MNRWKRVLVMAGATLALLASSIFPRHATAAEYPNVAGLKAFTAEANYMSLAGYLRFLVFQQDATWITRKEAVRIVMQQQGKTFAQTER